MIGTAVRPVHRGESIVLKPLPEGVTTDRWHIHDLDGCAQLAFPLRPGPAGDRIEPGGPVLYLGADEVTVLERPHQLIELLCAHDPESSWASLSIEFADTETNLALACARSEKRRFVLSQAAVGLDTAVRDHCHAEHCRPFR